VWVFPGHAETPEALIGIARDIPSQHQGSQGLPIRHYLAGRLAAAGHLVIVYSDPTVGQKYYGKWNVQGKKMQSGVERFMQDAQLINRIFLQDYDIDAVGLSGGAQRLIYLLPLLDNLRSAYIAGYAYPTWVELMGNSEPQASTNTCLYAANDFWEKSILENYSVADFVVAGMLLNHVRIGFAANAMDNNLNKLFLRRELIPSVQNVANDLGDSGFVIELRGDDIDGDGKSVYGSKYALYHEYDVADYLDFLQEVRLGSWPNKLRTLPPISLSDSLVRWRTFCSRATDERLSR
jgi:hypothetical protein